MQEVPILDGTVISDETPVIDQTEFEKLAQKTGLIVRLKQAGNAPIKKLAPGWLFDGQLVMGQEVSGSDRALMIPWHNVSFIEMVNLVEGDDESPSA